MSITAVDDDAEHTSQTLAKVGYACPPVHSQFKPGQSGNPSGRDDAGYRGGAVRSLGPFDRKPVPSLHAQYREIGRGVSASCVLSKCR
jgi:hypothetical protein